MARDSKIMMPSSGGGLTTFYNESDSKIRISPQLTLGVIIVIGFLMILFNALL